MIDRRLRRFYERVKKLENSPQKGTKNHSRHLFRSRAQGLLTNHFRSEPVCGGLQFLDIVDGKKRIVVLPETDLFPV